MKARAVTQEVVVKPSHFDIAEFTIVGTAPYCQSKFSKKAQDTIRAKQAEGRRAKTAKKDAPRDFDDDYRQSQYISTEGWNGMPASAFRSAMISACRTAGVVMTRAKLAIFIVADGVDKEAFTPLVRILGKPRKLEGPMRNSTGGADIRVRAFWEEWSIKLRVRFDTDMISMESVSNLLARAGERIGVGEGRHDSRESVGCGWGTFVVGG